MLGHVIENMVVMIPLTTNIGRLSIPYAQSLGSSKSNGLRAKSVALVYQIRAFDRRRMVRWLGALDSDEVERLNEQVKELLTLT